MAELFSSPTVLLMWMMMMVRVDLISPCSAEFISESGKIHLYFLSFLKPDIAHVVEILLHARQLPVDNTMITEELAMYI